MKPSERASYGRIGVSLCALPSRFRPRCRCASPPQCSHPRVWAGLAGQRRAEDARKEGSGASKKNDAPPTTSVARSPPASHALFAHTQLKSPLSSTASYQQRAAWIASKQTQPPPPPSSSNSPGPARGARPSAGRGGRGAGWWPWLVVVVELRRSGKRKKQRAKTGRRHSAPLFFLRSPSPLCPRPSHHQRLPPTLTLPAGTLTKHFSTNLNATR